jgi:hypothetical protein
LIPGEVSVPTPVLSRARGDLPESHLPIVTLLHEGALRTNNRTKKRPRTKDGETHFQLSQTMRELKRKAAPSRYSVYEGIYNGLEILLKATTSNEPKGKSKGPRSLLSMCLGAVPRYISQEEALLETQLEETGKRSAINNRDISTEIYDDLEAFGSFGCGWKHLRIIVRSHGVQVVSDAIQAGLLDVEFCGVLVTLCTYLGAGREAEILLSSLLSSRQIAAPKSLFTRLGDNEQSRPLSILWNLVEQRKCFSYQYRALSEMISTGHLPLHWVATKEFGPIWTRAIQTLSSDSTEANIFVFMETMLSMLASTINPGRDETSLTSKRVEGSLFEATKQTFSSLLTTLTSITILSKETTTQLNSQDSTLTSSKHDHISVLLRSSLVQWKLSHSVNSQGTLLLFADLITRNQDNQCQFTNLDLLLNHLRQAKWPTQEADVRTDLVAFVCSVARCCGRGASTTGFEHLEPLHLLLENLANTREMQDGALLHGIIVDSAFAFAEHSPDRKHLDYAARMEAKFQLMKTELAGDSTPANVGRRARVGYRWEEGISEWVTATPAVNGTKAREVSALHSPDEIVYDTPFKLVRRTNNRGRNASQAKSQELPSSDVEGDDDANEETASDFPECTPSRTADLENSDNDSETDSPPRSIPIKPSYDEESADEIDSSDESQIGSTVISGSGPGSPGKSEHLDIDETFTSNDSSMVSSSSSNFRTRRQYIDRAPRLSRRVLRHSLQWQLFEESDDELSFQSTSSSQSEQILGDITNSSVPRKPREGKSYTTKRQKPLMNLSASFLGDSEDELCI